MLVEVSQPHWYNAEWWTAASGAGQLITAIVAGWAALEAKRSAEAARDAVGVARESVQSTEKAARYRDRAYLAVEDTLGPKRVFADTPITMTFIYKNVGLTPAYQVEICSNVILQDVRPTEHQMDDSLTVWHQLGAAPPTLQLKTTAEMPASGRSTLGEVTLGGLVEGKGVLVLYAKLRYNDVFGDRHETKVAYEFSGDLRNFHLATYFNQMT